MRFAPAWIGCAGTMYRSNQWTGLPCTDSIFTASMIQFAPIIAEFVDVLARHAHRLRKVALRQAERLHEFIDQNFANTRRAAATARSYSDWSKAWMR